MLLGPCWGTHWELEEHVWELIGNLMGAHWGKQVVGFVVWFISMSLGVEAWREKKSFGDRPLSLVYHPKKHKKGANKEQQGVCGLAICIKNYLKAKKKNYGNSNISPCKIYINLPKKKSSKRNQNPSRYIKTL